MANITIETSSDFKKIFVKSDNADTNTNYPVMEVYLDSVLKYTLVVGGTATVGGTDYTTTSGADNLDFTATTTTNGTEYVHQIDTSTLTTGSALNVLSDGVWEFKLLDANAVTNIFIGILVHDDLDCCISSKLSKLCTGKTTGCSLEDVIELANKIRGLIYSGNISAKYGEFKNAECQYKLAKAICDGDCGCGCS
jgi:hypothetical protein